MYITKVRFNTSWRSGEKIGGMGNTEDIGGMGAYIIAIKFQQNKVTFRAMSYSFPNDIIIPLRTHHVNRSAIIYCTFAAAMKIE